MERWERRVKKLMASLGLNRQQFAAHMGIDRKTVYLWLSGKTQPSYDGLRAVEKAERDLAKKVGAA